MSSSPPPRAISPPTPAPSPQPDLQAHLRLASNLSQQSTVRFGSASFDPNDPSPLLKHLSVALPQLTHSARFRFLSGLVDFFDLRELAHLAAEFAPRLKVDFLGALPIEVSLHIISFIDDPKTLARASRVNRFWRSLVNDEHTWKAMCFKHKYRRRGSSSAGLSALDERYMRDFYATPRASIPRFHALGPRQHASGSTDATGSNAGSGLLPSLSESGADEQAEGLYELADVTRDQEADSMVLASLYQRYRDRGLDPSNALHELRTLHDLFLSKQDGGSLVDQMSDADRTFYAQLEEIVVEESRERYGDNDDMIEEDVHHHPAGASSSSSMQVTQAVGSHPASIEEHAGSSNLGWLGAGPSLASNGAGSAAAAAARMSTPAHAISGAYRTPTGRLDRLRNWRELHYDAAGLQGSSSVQPTAVRTSALGLGLSAEACRIEQEHAAEGSGDARMSVDEGGAAEVTPFMPRSPQPDVVALRDGLPQIPLHDSPTTRFSTQPSDSGQTDETGSSSSARHGKLVPGRNMAVPTAPRLDNSWAEAAGTGASSSKKARRRSAPIVDAQGQPLGLGRVLADAGESSRSATVGHADGLGDELRPFSYRTHFKLAYLTESNWLRGGRCQTKYVSAEAGSVVTSLAIDSEWIVVGMANAKIHVFDAETGLYSQTLLGHESGVWCLALVSRTGKKRSRTKSDNRAFGKSKMVITDPEDGLGGKPYLAAADGDLRLTHHDPRPDASSALLSDLEFNRYKEEQARRRHRGIGRLIEDTEVSGLPRSSSHSLAFDSHRQVEASESDETLEWFHKARRAMLQKASQANSSADSADGGAPTEFGAANDRLRAFRRLGSDLQRPASASATSPLRESVPGAGPTSATRPTDSAHSDAAAIAEAEAGFVRDAVMADGTGHVPAHLAEEMERNRGGAAAPSFELGGNAAGLGNPCASVLGYGNEEAIVVSGGCDRDVRVWDLKTGECKYVLSGHTSTTRCLKVLDGRPVAISGSRDATLRVWNIETGEHMHLLAGHQHSVRCMEVSGNKVASGSYDCTCRVWDVDTGECLRLLRGHIHQIYTVAFDGQRIATGSLDSTVRVWSMETGECLALFQGHTQLVGQLQLTDKMLVTGGSDGRVIVFSLETFECIHRLCAHDNSVTCMQFDDRYIVTGGNDGRVKLWDFATGRYIRDVCEPCEQVWKVNYWNDKVVVLCKRDERTCMEVITFRPTADQF